MRGIAILVMVAMLAGGVGCSAMATKKATVRIDSEKVGLVNAAARQRGVDVIWVNPPRKRADDKIAPANVAGNDR